MKQKLLFVILFFFAVPIFANDQYNVSELSDGRFVIYRVSDEEVLAEITKGYTDWKLNCVNGVRFGENFAKFTKKDDAIMFASRQCKIGRIF